LEIYGILFPEHDSPLCTPVFAPVHQEIGTKLQAIAKD
jgi:hypothetical protein